MKTERDKVKWNTIWSEVRYTIHNITQDYKNKWVRTGPVTVRSNKINVQ